MEATEDEWEDHRKMVWLWNVKRWGEISQIMLEGVREERHSSGRVYEREGERERE